MEVIKKPSWERSQRAGRQLVAVAAWLTMYAAVIQTRVVLCGDKCTHERLSRQSSGSAGGRRTGTGPCCSRAADRARAAAFERVATILDSTQSVGTLRHEQEHKHKE